MASNGSSSNYRGAGNKFRNRNWAQDPQNQTLPDQRGEGSGSFYEEGRRNRNFVPFKRGRGHSRGRGYHDQGHKHWSSRNHSNQNGQFRNQNRSYRRKPMKENDFKKENFYCCGCERGFKSEEQYEEHKKEHIVCGLEGCQFEAHSLVVTKHIRIQHEGNLYQRMKNLTTPEDIQRWREERMKNYPTLGRVQEKVAEKKERIDRREMFSAPNDNNSNNALNPEVFCYRIRPRDPRDFAYAAAKRRLCKAEYDQSDEWMKRSFAPDLRARHIRVPFFSMNKSRLVSLENFYLSVSCGKDGESIQKERKVKWKGFKVKTLERLQDSDSEDDNTIPISDEEEDFFSENLHSENLNVIQDSVVGDSITQTGDTQVQKNCLGLSLVDYSSASESGEDNCDDEVGMEAAPEESQNVQSLVIGNSAKARDETDDDSESGSESEEDEDDFQILDYDSDSIFTQKPTFSQVNGRRYKRHSRPQLLERLLHEQIRKERNALLQVCRFVNENDFFGIR